MDLKTDEVGLNREAKTSYTQQKKRKNGGVGG
jgi:hypothetical protein